MKGLVVELALLSLLLVHAVCALRPGHPDAIYQPESADTTTDYFRNTRAQQEVCPIDGADASDDDTDGFVATEVPVGDEESTESDLEPASDPNRFRWSRPRTWFMDHTTKASIHNLVICEVLDNPAPDEEPYCLYEHHEPAADEKLLKFVGGAKLEVTFYATAGTSIRISLMRKGAWDRVAQRYDPVVPDPSENSGARTLHFRGVVKLPEMPWPTSATYYLKFEEFERFGSGKSGKRIGKTIYKHHMCFKIINPITNEFSNTADKAVKRCQRRVGKLTQAMMELKELLAAATHDLMKAVDKGMRVTGRAIKVTTRAVVRGTSAVGQAVGDVTKAAAKTTCELVKGAARGCWWATKMLWSGLKVISGFKFLRGKWRAMLKHFRAKAQENVHRANLNSGRRAGRPNSDAASPRHSENGDGNYFAGNDYDRDVDDV